MAAGLLTVLATAPAGAQLLPPEPDRFAVSIGVSAVFPTGALADQNPLEESYYATAGTAFKQRFSYAPWHALGFFLEASFPAFGVDVEAVQRDFGVDPPVVDGGNDISSWSAGVRWRRRGEWLRGPYVEALVGLYRQRLELKQRGNDPQQETYDWRPGAAVAVGWAVPLGTAFALDVATTFSQYREEKQGNGFVNRWTNRWWGLRFLAVLTFGGGG